MDITIKDYFKNLNAKDDKRLTDLPKMAHDIPMPKVKPPKGGTGQSLPKDNCIHDYRFTEKRMLIRNGYTTNEELYIFYCTKCLELKAVYSNNFNIIDN